MSGNLAVPFDNGRGRAEKIFDKHKGSIIDVLKVLVAHEVQQHQRPDSNHWHQHVQNSQG